MKRFGTIAAILAAGFSTLAVGAVAMSQPAASAPASASAGGFKVGDKVASFVLKDTQGNEHNLQKYLDEGKVVVLEWYNPDCPVVKAFHEQSKVMAKTAAFAKENGVVWLAINSGGEGQQGYGVERNEASRKDYGISYPILMDPSGKVGKMFDAKTTPDMRIITKDGILAYRGAIDNGNTPEGRGKSHEERVNFVLQALKEHLAGETITVTESRPYGCSVKYAHAGHG